MNSAFEKTMEGGCRTGANGRDQPAISVLMPVYNAEKYLAEAVESILNQTFGDFEFIIINDGSTDGSLRILERYAAQDARIRLVSRGNTGYVAALNEGLGMARAPYVARMDADDISLPGRFAVQHAYLESHPEVVCVGGGFRLIDRWSRVVGEYRLGPLDDAAVQRGLLRGANVLCHPATMFRRGAWTEAGGYDETFGPAEDLDLWLRMGERGRLSLLADIVLCYRQHGESVSESRQSEQLAMLRRACEAAWTRRGHGNGQTFVAGPWRPDESWRSRHAYALRYGWGAFRFGHWATALDYGLRAVWLRPWKREGWMLAACALLKRRPVVRGGGRACS